MSTVLNTFVTSALERMPFEPETQTIVACTIVFPDATYALYVEF
jgi:hypothetical protein